MCRADNLTPFACPLSRNSGNFNLLEPHGPLQDCIWTGRTFALPEALLLQVSWIPQSNTLSCVVPLDKSWSKRTSCRKALDNHISHKDDKMGTVNLFNQLDVTWRTPGTFYREQASRRNGYASHKPTLFSC